MDTTMLPCPFCGSQADEDFIEGESYIIECRRCGAKTDYQDDEESAYKAWNMRPETPAQEK